MAEIGKDRTLIVRARHYPAEILRKSAGLAQVMLMQVKDKPKLREAGPNDTKLAGEGEA